jgi:hypothetical protein
MGAAGSVAMPLKDRSTEEIEALIVAEFGDKFRPYADDLREDGIDGATLDDPDLNIDNVLSDLNVKKEIHKSKLKRGLNALRLSGTQNAPVISKTEKIATAVDSAANEGEDGVEAFESKVEERTAKVSKVIEPRELGAMRMCDDLSKSNVDNDQGPTDEASTILLDLSANSAPRHEINVRTNVAELDLDLMVVARARLEQDLKAVMAEPCEDEAKKCSTSMVNVVHIWGKTKEVVFAAATALDKRVKAGDMIGSAESAIELTQITRAILVELRTLTGTLKKMGKRIAAIKERKVSKALKSALEAAQQDLKGEAAALKKRLASNPEAIRILVEAREHLVRDCGAFMASPGKEAWEGCALHLRMLVDSWVMVRRAIMAAVEELRGKASDKDLEGGAKSAVTFAQLLRGAVIELLELMNALRELKQQMVVMEGGMKGVVEALDTAREELKGLRTVLMQTSAEHILEGGELQQLKAEAAVDEGDALLDFAEMMVNSVSVLPIPGLGFACAMLSGAVGAAQKVHELASDALEMTESMFEIGRYMIDLQRLAMRMKEVRKVELEHHMGKLAELMGEMREAIQAFGQRGFLTKMLASAKVVRRLATIERRKEAILKAMDRILQTAQTELLLDAQDRVPLETKEHTYALVEAVWAKVAERTKANGGDVDVETDVSEAAEEIMRSPADMKEVADRAGLSEEAFKEEMALVLAAVKEGFEEVKVEMKEIKSAVQEESGKTRGEIKNVMHEIKGAVNEIKGAMTEIKGVAGLAISASDTIQDDMNLLTVAHLPRQEASTDGAAIVLVGATAGKFIEVLWCFLRLFLCF